MVITEWFYNNPISILSKRAETLNIVINSKLSRACPTEQNIFTIQTSKIVLFLFLQHRFDFSQRLGNNAEWWTWGDTLVTNRIPLSTCRFSHHLSDLNASQNRIKSVDSVITDWLHSIRGTGISPCWGDQLIHSEVNSAPCLIWTEAYPICFLRNSAELLFIKPCRSDKSMMIYHLLCSDRIPTPLCPTACLRRQWQRKRNTKIHIS